MATGNRNSVLKQRPVKKVKAQKRRHERVSEEFQKWLKKNPKAKRRQKIRAFDMYCDSAILAEQIEQENNGQSN
jgi:hypothetical protein